MQTVTELMRGMAVYYKEPVTPEGLRMYLERLSGYPYSVVKAAIDSWIDTQPWFPKVSQLLDQIKVVQSANPRPLLLLCEVGAGLREKAIQAGPADYWDAIWEWDAHMKRCGTCTDKGIGGKVRSPKQIGEVI